MTVSSSTSQQTFNCDGTTDEFTCDFRVLDSSDMLAYLVTISTGAASELTNGVDFTVSGAGDQNAVVTTTTTYSNLYRLRCQRLSARLQETDYSNLDSFPAETHENALDRLTHIVQELDGDISRSIRAPFPESVSDLPAASSRANKILSFDSDGHPVAVAPTSGDATDLALQLASTDDETENAGQVGFSAALAYASGTVGYKLSEVVSVLDSDGVTGDGIADDTAGLILAEADAFARGAWLEFPAGRTFTTSTGLTFRVPILGTGATLLCTASSESLSSAVINYTSITNATVFGLTIDCADVRRGLLFTDCTGVRVERVKVNDALFGGIAAYDSTDVNIAHCDVDGAIYPTPSTGHAADGFYIGSCEGVVVSYCTAKNFERIGFVTEGEISGVKSDRVLYIGCHAEDAKNCDDSATEFNAAFWNENTNSATYIGCTGKNISSGTGQTNGRVRGFVTAVGSSRRCKVNYFACGIYGNTVDIPIAFNAQGTSNFPSVNYEGCFAVGCESGFYTLGGLDVLTYEQCDVDDITSGSGEGAVVLDISANGLNEVHIDGLRVSNKTYSADAADIDWFSAHASTVYTLNNAWGLSHIMRQAVARATVTNSSVEFGSATYACFSAESRLTFGAGAVLTPRSGATEKRLFQDFQMSGATVHFNGSTLSSSSTFEMTYGGASVNILASGATFDGLTINMNMTGSYTHQFTGCRILNVPATDGFYKSNGGAPTKQVLIFTGNYFAATNAANTPLRKGTSNPTNTVLQGNTYNTTNLYTFDGGVTQANNTAV